MDTACILPNLGMLLLGVLLDQLFWRYRRSIERADVATDSGRELLRVALRPIYTDLTDALSFHREQAATRQHPGATHAAMIAGMRTILDDPAVPWPADARRRAEALTAQYAQSGGNDAQAAADAAEALRRYLASLLH